MQVGGTKIPGARQILGRERGGFREEATDDVGLKAQVSIVKYRAGKGPDAHGARAEGVGLCS